MLIWLSSYNSVIFASISNNQYYVMRVNTAFTEGGPYNLSKSSIMTSLRQAVLSKQNTWEVLDNANCIKAYASDFQSTRSNLLLVTSDKTSTATAHVESLELVGHNRKTYGCAPDSYSWICAKPICKTSCKNRYQQEVLPYPSSWAPQKFRGDSSPISHCLSQKTIEHCKLHFSVHLIIVIVVFNILKAVSMCYAVFGIMEEPLMTLGDAVSSFLARRDASTLGCCLFTKNAFDYGQLVWEPMAGRWSRTNMRWFCSASVGRWLTCNFL